MIGHNFYGFCASSQSLINLLIIVWIIACMARQLSYDISAIKWILFCIMYKFVLLIINDSWIWFNQITIPITLCTARAFSEDVNRQISHFYWIYAEQWIILSQSLFFCYFSVNGLYSFLMLINNNNKSELIN